MSKLPVMSVTEEIVPTINVNGETIHYQLHKGDEGRPALVLVHGAGGNYMHWPAGLRRLVGNRVIALDLPGHGDSSGAGRQTVADYAAVVCHVTKALNLGRIVLAGHSMGGAIAQEFALTYPERLAGLVLVGTGARLRVAPQILDGLMADFEGTTAMVTAWAHGPDTPSKMLQEYTRRLRHVPVSVIRGDYLACDAFDRRPDVSRISAPTLIICGTADRMTPLKYSEWLREQIPDAELVRIPDAGHMVMLEAQSQVVEAVTEFLAKLP